MLSGDLDLDVEINSEDNSVRRDCDSLQVVLHPSSCARWVSLVIRAKLIEGTPGENFEEGIRESMRAFYDDLSSLDVPRLSKLCLLHELEEYELDTDDPTGDPSDSVQVYWFGTAYETWSAPRIREVVTNGHSLPLHLRTSLTKLTLNLDSTYLESFGDLGDLLSTFSSIQELCIRVSTFHRGFLATPRERWFLPSVSRLRLEWEFQRTYTSQTVTNIDLILSRILFPNLTSLQVELEAFGGAIDNSILPQFSGSSLFDVILFGLSRERRPRFPKLTALEFCTTENIFDQDHGDFFIPIHKFRDLQHLALEEIPKSIFPSEGGESSDYYASRQPPSSLQTVFLRKCDGMTAKGVKSFLEALQKVNEGMGRWTSRLERFSVLRCGNVDEDELGVSFGDTKIFYAPE